MARLRQDMVEMEKSKAALETRMKQEMDQVRTSMTFRVSILPKNHVTYYGLIHSQQHELGTSRKAFPNVNSTIKKRQFMGSSHTPSSTQPFSRGLELQSSPLSPTKRSTRKPPGPQGKQSL
jgi:hypothetical protein